MKVIMLCKTRIMTGKMAEYVNLEKKMFAICDRIGGMPPWRRLNLVSGKGDLQHTIVYQFEFDNFAAMDSWTQMLGDAEMAALMPQFDSVIESHEHDVYMEMPMPGEQG
jgi:antibiotic biosynthesis monooxygenase (ABM) superfamily enzyme